MDDVWCLELAYPPAPPQLHLSPSLRLCVRLRLSLSLRLSLLTLAWPHLPTRV